jgi:hypothetical protein
VRQSLMPPRSASSGTSVAGRCSGQRTENVPRSWHQQGSQIRIAFLTGVRLRLTLAGVPPSWFQAQE